MQYKNRNRYYSTKKRDPRINRSSGAIYASGPRAMHLVLGLCFLVMAVMAVSIPSGGDPKNSEKAVAATPEAKKEYKPVDAQQLSVAINDIIAKNPQMDIGVSVTDLATGTSYTYGVDNQFIAASVGKLLSATLYLHQTEQGLRYLDEDLGGQTARSQIQKMVAMSDNSAWQSVNGSLGHPALQAYAGELGLTSYDPKENKIKPSEVAKLISNLYQGKLLNSENTKFLLANMQQDQEEMQFIRKYVDPSVTVYHKAGWLEDRAHDTAVIENGERPFTLVVFTKARSGVYNFEKGQTLFSKITAVAQERFKL